MPVRRFLAFLLACLLPAAAAAQGPAPARLRLRTLLHDPLNPFAELYVAGSKGGLERLNLAMEGLSAPQEVSLVNGTLQLFSSATIDPAKPPANLAATGAVTAGLKRVIVLIVPAAAGSKPPYKLLLLDDAPSNFPWGESRAINLTTTPLAVAAGELRVQVKPAAITAIGKVTKLNDLNQAPTRFYQKDGEEWVLFSERPTQFTDTLRNVFLLYTMPGVPDIQVRTLIDSMPPAAPRG